MQKCYVCSIVKYPNEDKNATAYALEMLELTEKGFNHNHELKFEFVISPVRTFESLLWEKAQVKHYFEYDLQQPCVLCNDPDVFENISPVKVSYLNM